MTHLSAHAQTAAPAQSLQRDEECSRHANVLQDVSDWVPAHAWSCARMPGRVRPAISVHGAICVRARVSV